MEEKTLGKGAALSPPCSPQRLEAPGRYGACYVCTAGVFDCECEWVVCLKSHRLPILKLDLIRLFKAITLCSEGGE